jgi:hypothetical protein
MILCGKCHKKIHGKEPIELPSMDEVVEEE